LLHPLCRARGLGGSVEPDPCDGRFPLSEPRTVTLRGTSEPVEIVTVDWS